jgi:hypothetical protein
MPLCSICNKEIKKKDFAGYFKVEEGTSNVFHFDCGMSEGFLNELTLDKMSKLFDQATSSKPPEYLEVLENPPSAMEWIEENKP